MTIINGYEQSDREQKLDILNLPSLEHEAAKIIPKGGFGYISGGSEDEWTLRENTEAFNHVQIVPRALTNMEQPTTETQIFGIPLKTPIMMAPAAAQGLAHARGEKARASWVSMPSRHRESEPTMTGRSPNTPTFRSSSKAWKATRMPCSPGAGAQGIYVSNHDGRQLNGGPASFDMLHDVAKAVNHRVPIIFDSGVRRGSHVFKALASGADLVALARPVIYGLALGGAQGVASVINHLNDELLIDMQLAGTKTIEDVKHAKLIRR